MSLMVANFALVERKLKNVKGRKIEAEPFKARS